MKRISCFIKEGYAKRQTIQPPNLLYKDPRDVGTGPQPQPKPEPKPKPQPMMRISCFIGVGCANLQILVNLSRWR